MARDRRGGGRQQPMKGFRPGKEPAQLRKQRAKAQLGDASWAQKQLIDVVADRSPEEARAMMRRWRTVALVVAIALLAAGLALYRWSVAAGVVVHVLAVAALVLWFRLHRQRAHFEALVDLVGGRRR